jgi:serine/threonine-protein kinase
MEMAMAWQAKWIAAEVIDRGGQGVVTKLHRKENPEQHAVLKQIVDRWRGNPQAILRMRQEAEVLCKLNAVGARVPEVYESLLDHEGSEPFIVTEYIHGVRFDEWLKKTAPIATADAVELTLAIAETISLCHQQSIGHRDIKPANIILKDGNVQEPYVLDFGISFDSRQSVTLTRDGEMFWNEFIILPECQDLKGNHRDLRSDITALVGLFFYCITGQQPVMLQDAQGHSPHRRLNQKTAFPKAASMKQTEHLMWFFDKGLAYRIEGRFQTMDEFIKELSQFDGKSSNNAAFNIFAEFKNFNEQIQKQNRTVQLGVMRDAYAKIQNEITSRLAESMRRLNNDGGEFGYGTLRPPMAANPSLPSNGALLFHNGVTQYKLARTHFSRFALVILAPFAVDAQIHLYAASYTTTASNLDLAMPDTDLEWSRIAVIDTPTTPYPVSSDNPIIEEIQSLFAREFRGLAQHGELAEEDVRTKKEFGIDTIF